MGRDYRCGACWLIGGAGSFVYLAFDDHYQSDHNIDKICKSTEYYMLKINTKLRQCLLNTYSEPWLNHMPIKAEIYINVTYLEPTPKM